MDQDRTIRFHVAPMLFLASLLWGLWADDPSKVVCLFKEIGTEPLSKLVSIIAAGGLVVFVGGYVIGTITHAMLRFFFPFFVVNRWCYSADETLPLFHEAGLHERDFEKVWRRINAFGEARRKDELSAVVAYDFGVLRKNYEGVHQWLVRRWNAFNIATTSFVGLLLSIPIGHCVVKICWTYSWLVPVILFSILLLVVANWAWKDGRDMLGFMARLPERVS
jgi:hypothetical protein